MFFISLLILLSFIPFIDVVSMRRYPDEKIPTNNVDDSLSTTSVPKVFNWTHNNQQHFIIFSSVPFDLKIAYGCVFDDNNILLTFITPKNSDKIYGYCISQIEGEEEFLNAECHEKNVKDVECIFGYIEDFICEKSRRKNSHFPKNESPTVVTPDNQINYFWLFLLIIFGTCIGSLVADVARNISYVQTFVQTYIHRYFPAPAN